MSIALLVAVVLVVSLAVGLQVVIRARARAMRGRAVPDLPGDLGRGITAAPQALLYFFSPGCAPCKQLTPRFAALRRTNPAVHLIDVSQELGIARSFQVMGTPSVVEIAGGRIVGYHVGSVPPAVMERFES